MYYIIDGYNLFFEMFDTDPSIQNRQNFVLLISTLLSHTAYTAEMIFDMPCHHSTPFPHSREKPPLTISYAPTNLEADDLIVEKLYAIEKPHMVTIVTSDKELSYRVKEVGGCVITSKKFLSMLMKRKKTKSPLEKPSSETLTQQERLEKIFIKKLQDTNE